MFNDFVNWCLEENLVDVDADGTVTYKEEAIKGPKTGKYKQDFGGGRDQRKDLSGDYKDYCHHMGTVWPFKVIAKGGKKAVASVAK